MPTRRLAAVTLLALAGSSASAEVWNNPSVGSWTDPANWTPMTVPNGVGASAEIISTESGGVFENPGAITSPVPITLGSLDLDMGIGGPFLNIVCPGVTFDNGGGADVFLTGDATGVASIDAPITLRGNLRTSWTASNTFFNFPITGDYGISSTPTSPPAGSASPATTRSPAPSKSPSARSPSPSPRPSAQRTPASMSSARTPPSSASRPPACRPPSAPNPSPSRTAATSG